MAEEAKGKITTAEEKDPKIFVMPERFLGVPPGARPAEDVAVTRVVREKRKFPLIPVVIGGVAIIAVGAVVYFSLPKPKKAAQTPVNQVNAQVNFPQPSINEAVNENINIAPVETATTTPAETPAEEGIKAGLDSDGDGLTDAEEPVYGSDINNPDTDSDSYLDGHEVFHLYNPLGRTPQRLLDTGAVKVYTNAAQKYKIYYPAPWAVQNLSGTDGGVMFSSGTGEFIEVLTESNTDNLPIISWYLTQSPGVKVGELETFVTKNGTDGIKSPDRLTAYFTNGGMVYIVSYNIGVKTEINYKRTFEMMLNSLEILK